MNTVYSLDQPGGCRCVSMPCRSLGRMPEVARRAGEMRYNAETLTALLRDAVPAFARAGIRFTSIHDGAAESLLPLEIATTNQHATHQAAVIALAGDYTGGAALGNVLPEVPLAGVHPVYGSDGACLWLARFEITYHMPSTTDLKVQAVVPREQHEAIRAGFWKGKAAMLPQRVTFSNDAGQLVAEGVFVYYLRHAAHIAARAPNQRAGIMHQHLLKSSARLVANVRGRECDRDNPRYHDPYSRKAAAKHGELLGDRFCALLPQLREMVAARTCDADRCLRRAVEDGVRQLVLVGAGLDFRPFRLAGADTGVRCFELDLPEMIAERERCLATLELPRAQRVGVAFNLLCDAPGDVLSRVEDFNPHEPVFVIYEGCSMYFDDRQSARIFERLAALVEGHPASRMWLDLVSRAVGSGKTDHPEIRAFLDGMARMGEPFIFGHDEPERLFGHYGLRVIRQTRSDAYLDGPGSDVFGSYRFVLLEPSPQGSLPA